MHKIVFLGHRVCASGAMKVVYSTVSTQRNFVAEFHRVLLIKQRISVSEAPFEGGLGGLGNVCDSLLACWKAHNRLPIGYN